VNEPALFFSFCGSVRIKAMKKNLRYVPMILGCGVVMALVLLFLLQWTGYAFNAVNVILFSTIALCLVKAMEAMERFHYASGVIQSGAVILSFVICLFYGFFVSKDIEGNELTRDVAYWALIVHGVSLVYILIHEKKRKKAEE
jgi:hypothetical protein